MKGRKRILVVSSVIGNSASGIVAEQWVTALNQAGYELVVACNNSNVRFSDVSIFDLPETKNISQLDKIKYILFNSDVRWRQWRKKFLKKYNAAIKKFDPEIIWIIASGQSDCIPRLGYEIAKNLEMPYHIHTLDAIPSPTCWGVLPSLRRAVGTSVRKIYRNAKTFSSTNQVMTEYLTRYHGLKDAQLKTTLYNPVNTDFIKGSQTQEYALYLGNLGGSRDGKALFDSMPIVEKEYPEFKFVFAGTNPSLIKRHYKGGILPKNISIISPVNPPDELIRKAQFLIDIDIESKGDVYMSSKLIRYLNSNIPILNISTNGSPASSLIKTYNGFDILTVDHEPYQIKAAVDRLKKIKTAHFESTKRKEFVVQFGMEEQVFRLIKLLYGP